MKITIVTISYNQAPFLRRCIDSILLQEGVDLEYIVVDPGSSDGSRAIIESYGDRLTKIFLRDSGPAEGLNNGFSKATGDVYGFINSDDYLLPGALKRIGDIFKEINNNNIFVSGFGYTECSDGARSLIKPSVMTNLKLTYGVSTIFQQSTFFRSCMFNNVGGFNSNNKTCWDFELFLDFIIYGYKHKVFNDEIAIFSIHPDSITGSGRQNEAYRKELHRIFENTFGRRMNFSDFIIRFCLRVVKKIGL